VVVDVAVAAVVVEATVVVVDAAVMVVVVVVVVVFVDVVVVDVDDEVNEVVVVVDVVLVTVCGVVVVVAVDVVVVVVVVELVEHPPIKEAPDPSQLSHFRSELAVGSSDTYCPSVHSVIGVHSRSLSPAAGGFDSHSPALHSFDVWQTTLLVAVPFFATISSSLQVPCNAHSCNECASSFRNVPSGHCAHLLLDASRNSPLPHARCVVVVAVVEVTEVAVAVVTVVVEIEVLELVDVFVLVVVLVVLDVDVDVDVDDVVVVVGTKHATNPGAHSSSAP